MQLSVILVNYRGWKKLRSCLESLKCLATLPIYSEIIIVDNQSADGELAVFIRDFPDFTFIENTGNHGFAHGCNYGASVAKGDFLLFLNPDTIVNAEAIQQLYTTASKYTNLAILTCRQVTTGQNDTRPYGLFLKPGTLFSSFRAVYRLFHSPVPVTQLETGISIQQPDWVSGSLILLSRQTFDQLKGWDEDYWMYYEDMDLCRRVRNQGGEIALLLNVAIIHNHGGASRINAATRALTKSEVLISKHVYVSKHFSRHSQAIAQGMLVINNLLLVPLLLALLGLLFWFIPGLNTYAVLYRMMIRYYYSVIIHKKWISPRSFRF